MKELAVRRRKRILGVLPHVHVAAFAAGHQLVVT